MSYRFYKSHKKVIEFNCKNEVNKIVFNHYIMRKVNHHRMKGDLPDNQFKFTTRGASNDLSLSRATVSRLVCELEEKGIIECVKKASMGESISIYEYATEEKSRVMRKIEPVSETLDEPVSEPVKISEFKALSEFDVPVGEIGEDPVDETFKIKYINKVLNKDSIYYRVVEYLNKKTSKTFKSTTNKTKSLILARFKEGFVEEDFYRVIDIKSSEWLATNMEKYIRPETLFSNKFESYLNERTTSNLDSEQINQNYQNAKSENGKESNFDTNISKLNDYNSKIEMLADSYKIDFKY